MASRAGGPAFVVGGSCALGVFRDFCAALHILRALGALRILRTLRQFRTLRALRGSRPRFPRFSVCLALAIALGSATGAHAQTQPREPGQQTQVQLDGASMEVRRIGLIDLDGVVRRSNGTARVRELLDEQRELFQREFAAREIALQQTERELVARRDSLSEADFSARLADFEAEVVTIQQEIQYRRESIDIAFQDAQADIRRLAIDIVAEIAGELQLDLVLVRESALIFLPTLNISEAVLQRLDERTTNARFEISVDSDSPGGG